MKSFIQSAKPCLQAALQWVYRTITSLFYCDCYVEWWGKDVVTRTLMCQLSDSNTRKTLCRWLCYCLDSRL